MFNLGGQHRARDAADMIAWNEFFFFDAFCVTIVLWFISSGSGAKTCIFFVCSSFLAPLGGICLVWIFPLSWPLASRPPPHGSLLPPPWSRDHAISFRSVFSHEAVSLPLYTLTKGRPLPILLLFQSSNVLPPKVNRYLFVYNRFYSRFWRGKYAKDRYDIQDEYYLVCYLARLIIF